MSENILTSKLIIQASPEEPRTLTFAAGSRQYIEELQERDKEDDH